jgi:23S rRNA pseudouridine1911/1915/1917 synthase
MPGMRQPGGPDPAATIELRSRVPPRAAGQALLDYLVARFPYHAPAIWRAELATGRITVDGERGFPELRLRAGAQLCYRKQHVEPPVDRAIQLLHVAAAFAVVVKPAHLPVHADGPFIRHTLIHLLHSEHGLAGAQLVHRLDRETSGLLVVARTATARAALAAQFAVGAVRKEYLAVVHGAPPDVFACRQPIGHATGSAIALRRSAAAGARDPHPAHTDFAVLRRGPRRALVRCTPTTGRTHQLRVHLEHCGFPIVGDKLYGRADADYLAFVAAVKAGADPRQATTDRPGRQLLHAAALRFADPTTGATLGFAAAEPPEFTPWLLLP